MHRERRATKSFLMVKVFITLLLIQIFFTQQVVKAETINELTTVHVDRAVWNGDPKMGGDPAGDFYDFLITIPERASKSDGEQLHEFKERAGTSFILRAAGQEDLIATISSGFGNRIGWHGWTLKVSFLDKMKAGIAYEIIPPVSHTAGYEWLINDNVTITKPQSNGSTPISGIQSLELTEKELHMAIGGTAKFKVYAVDGKGNEKDITLDKKVVYRTDSGSIVDVKAGVVKAGKKKELLILL